MMFTLLLTIYTFQIVLLQKELKNPMAMELIDKLQSQLHEVQREIISKNTQRTNNPSARQKAGEKDPTSECVVSLGYDSELVGSGQDISQTVSVVNSKKLSGTKGSVQKPDVASRNMSKTQLLREVRKQKDEHRKHIRSDSPVILALLHITF